jgi:phosphoglycerol transferase MdoB-like AlkP superfamily enzyme
MNDATATTSATADTSSFGGGLLVAIGVTVVLVIAYGTALSGGILEVTHQFVPLFLLLSPLLILALVVTLLVLRKQGRLRAMTGFAVTMAILWLPLIVAFHWLVSDFRISHL